MLSAWEKPRLRAVWLYSPWSFCVMKLELVRMRSSRLRRLGSVWHFCDRFVRLMVDGGGGMWEKVSKSDSVRMEIISRHVMVLEKR